MSEEKPNVPKLRFPGFADPWEQRKLGEIAEIVGGGTPNTSVEEYWDGDIDWYTPAELGDRRYVDSSLRKITQAGYDNSSARMLPANRTILFTSRAGIGNTAILCSSACTNQGFQSLVVGDSADVDFIYSLSDDIKRKAEIKASGSTFLEISGKRLTEIEVLAPALVEQVQIGSFFRQLDSLIALHQRKLDHLKEMKKGLLQKMFPKNGESIPELRFPGFTDPWEQRKLGEIAHRIIRKNGGNQSNLPLTISAQYGLVDQRDYFNNQVASRDMSGYYLLQNGEFAYNKSTSGDSPWGAVKRLTKYENGCVSTLYICFGLDEGDSDFLVTYYETDRWHKEVRMIAAEGARNHGLLNIAPSDFFETELTMPAEIEEQAQIGAFFQQLDSLITLHQRKLDHLKQMKKGLLQQMFV